MKLNVGVIGLGYWGPNFVRNFINQKYCQVIWGCDLANDNLDKIHKLYPHLKLTKNFSFLLKDNTIDLIAIATPPETHYQIVKAALENNKHILVTKPLTTKLAHAQNLLKIAKQKKLLLHCDSTYLYTPAVNIIKKIIDNGDIGKPLYYDSTRSNFGLIQKNVNVIWDLLPHDLSIIGFCFNLKPNKVFVTASKLLQDSSQEEIAHIAISYSQNFSAHIHLSWLSPVKLRTILIGGTQKMILFDDLQPIKKVKIFDKGVKLVKHHNIFKPIYKEGGVDIPKVKNKEPLLSEVNSVISKIRLGNIDYYNASLNTQIVNILEHCDKSLRQNTWITIK